MSELIFEEERSGTQGGNEYRIDGDWYSKEQALDIKKACEYLGMTRISVHVDIVALVKTLRANVKPTIKTKKGEK